MYGSQVALSGVTAAFPAGSTGLLGVNGAGKSTLMLVILGLVEPTSGHVEVLGLDAARSPREVRARLGYVPECDASLPGLSALSSVVYCGQLAGLPAANALSRADDVLWYVGLGEVRHRDVETLSTGLKQRLRLAQALVHDPDLLLLDEPTNGLDPQGREVMLDLIWDLGHRRGINVIFASHLLPDVERTCDACVVLSRGALVADGAMGAWRLQSGRTFEVRVRGEEAAFQAALGAAGFTYQAAEDGTLTVEVPDGDPRPFFVIASRVRAQVRHVRPVVESLEDFFERVTRTPP
jgi:ABC-2 type transport system ATP-binding protein